MENAIQDKYFSDFIEMIREGTAKLVFKRNSFTISLTKDLQMQEINEFKKFTSNVISSLINNIISGKVTEDLEKYVETIKLKYPELVEQIKVKIFSNMNTLTDFDFELITSIPYKNYSNETENTSVLFKIEYEQPISGRDNQQSITMELSKKNLQDLKNEIDFLLKALG